jgi:hypothetical protein
MLKLNQRFGLGLIFLIALGMLSCMTVSSAQFSQSSNDTLKGKLLYEENFSTSKGSSMSGYVDATYSYGFQNGSYEFVVNPIDHWPRVLVGDNYGDIILEVEATPISGPNDNVYGVIVRKVDLNNYYSFLISGDGYYQILKYQNGSWSTGEWKKSSAIRTGKRTNLIRVACQGDNFSFYANDVLLQEYTDSSFSSGGIGLIAGTNEALGAVTIDFNNLRVWEIKK